MNKQPQRESVPVGAFIIALLILLPLIILAYFIYINLLRPSHPYVNTLDGEMMGMVIRDPWYDFGTDPDQPDQPNRAAQDRMGAMLQQMGVRWVRMEFHIEGSDLEVEKQLARNDYFIREVAPRYNLRVLGLLGFGLIRGQDPRILGVPTTEIDPVYGPGIDNARRIWLDRARQVVARYQGDIAAYQVLNEPNRVSPNWNETLPASEVAHLQTTFYTFFRHIDREAPGEQEWRDGIPIILGALQPAGSGQIDQFGYLSDRYYLQQLYASAAFTEYYAEYERYPLDGLGYHPYPQEVLRSLPPTPTPAATEEAATAEETAEPDEPPDPQEQVALMMQRLDNIRAVLVEVGDPQQPFWITELGHNAGFQQQNATTQTEFLRLAYAALAERPDVATVFWFKYEDFPPASGPDAQKWGTVRIPFTADPTCAGGACYDRSGRPTLLRPAFWAYRDLAGRSEDLPEPPAQVLIQGRLTARSGERLLLAATLHRATAAQPVIYSWEAPEQESVVHRGALHDQAAFAWSEPGTYRVMLEASNEGGTVIASQEIRVYPTLARPGLRRR